MRRLLTLSSLALIAVAGAACGPKPESPKPYDETADARAELNLALQQAKARSKRVLVVYGANWCADCQALARLMAKGALAEHIAQRYVVTKVDVGDFNKNLDLARAMGNATKKGIPALAVLAADGSFVRATQAGELASARRMGDTQVLAVLDALAAPVKP
ncbi:MAG: thioredoxin family protein [Burkholderiaceae bacterium]